MRILICSDGSKWATKSARFALQLFRDTAHELTVLAFKTRAKELETTQKKMIRGTREKEDNIGAQRSLTIIEEEAQDLVGELIVDTHEVHWMRQEGDMVSSILAIANDYDLICLGGAGKGGFSQNMLGLIVDEVVKKGDGNLMVTKKSDAKCRDVLVALMPETVTEELAHYLGVMFKGSPATITIDVLWEDLPERFEGYLNAATGQRVKQMVDADLFHDPHQLRDIVAIIESYGVDCSASYQDYKSLNQLIDAVEPASYDLIIVHPPSRDSGLLQLIEPEKQSLNLMRKSSANVMLLRSLPALDS